MLFLFQRRGVFVFVSTGAVVAVVEIIIPRLYSVEEMLVETANLLCGGYINNCLTTKAVVDMRFVDIYVDKELSRHVDKDFRMSTKIKKKIKPSQISKNTKIRV